MGEGRHILPEVTNMLAWISDNIGTILITLLLAAIVAAIVVGIVRGKRQGKSSCGGSCASCPMHGKCH